MSGRPGPRSRIPELYRDNVGLALFNKDGRVFYGRRVGMGLESRNRYQWQMPQGGIDEGETPRQAALRELGEEVGVGPALVEILEESEDWIYYDFPLDVRRRLARRDRRYHGQRQKWFALRFLGRDSDIRLDKHTPEFSAWRWGALGEAPKLIIPFKRAVYAEIARRFVRFGKPV